MRPCDCKSSYDVVNYLNESGIEYNEWSITLTPNTVTISTTFIEFKIPQDYFRRFAEWYLEDQKDE